MSMGMGRMGESSHFRNHHWAQTSNSSLRHNDDWAYQPCNANGFLRFKSYQRFNEVKLDVPLVCVSMINLLYTYIHIHIIYILYIYIHTYTYIYDNPIWSHAIPHVLYPQDLSYKSGFCFLTTSTMSKHRPDLPCLAGAWRRPPNDLQVGDAAISPRLD